ncbi:MAG: YkgJ family cysteine cluster protein [Weeksellaceae bacterium]|nr:YkgJ family cysteine cluster protein [Weeksellaceae bacterium]
MSDIPTPENIDQQARLSHKQNKQFLDWMRKKQPKDLDAVAQATHDEVFEEVDCLQCANCCKTTGPLFTEKDIERIAAQQRMKPGKFAEIYLRKDEEGDWVLKSVPCPFLLADNSCVIYDVRPKACAEFPHTDRRKLYQINHLTIKNVAICPAAYAIVQRMQQHYLTRR